MARLIVKSPYIKCGGGNKSAGRYMNYIATRERVEILQDSRSPTRKQEQLIAKLTKDFPDVTKLPEYGDYAEKPTKAIASAFITMALKSYLDGQLGKLEDRLSAFSFRQSVETDMVAGILADSFQFSEDDLRCRRAESINNVKRTNGRISLEKYAREAWEGDG